MIGQIILFLIILFLPTQFGKHFWPPFTFEGGFRLDLLSPTIYFIDLLITLYIVTSIKKVTLFLTKNYRPILYFFVFVLLNILFSLSPLATIFLWVRWCFYFVFLLSLKTNTVKLSDIIKPLSISTILTVILQVAQFIKQSSLGGILYYLGERSLNQSTPQVAKLILNGQVFLRPYATFSHPNSFAGFLLVSLFLLNLNRSSLFTRTISILGILLSFSKTVIFTTILYLLNLFKKNYLPLIITLPIIILSFSPLIPLSSSLLNRHYLLNPFLNIIISHPLFGVGLGGYYTSLLNSLQPNQITPSLLQPIHNLPLLLLSEIGVVGMLIFIILLLKARINHYPKLFELFSLILLTGGFDHYWLTLPQNKLILLLAIYFVYNKHQ